MIKTLKLDTKFFSMRMAHLLEMYVPGSVGTALFITAVTCLMDPARNVCFGSPIEVVRSVSKGLLMLRLWRKYLILSGLPLDSKPGAASEKSKRGCFISKQTYDSLELQAHAIIIHQLAMFLHCYNRGKSYACTGNASTLATERFIGQSQAKTTELQSLCQEPSVAETLDRAGQVQYNLSVVQELAAKNVKVKPTNNRKKTAFKFSTFHNTTNYEYPDTFEEFKTQVCESFFCGVKDAQKEMTKLPQGFRDTLGEFWKAPFTFDHGKCQIIQETPGDSYDFLSHRRQNVNKRNPGDRNETALHRNVNESDDDSDENDDDQDNVYSAADVASDSDSEDESHIVSEPGMCISKGKGTIHLSTALKLAMRPKDYVHKERSKRHIVYPLRDIHVIPGNHDVILFRHYAIKHHPVSVIHIVSIEAENGSSISSTSKSGKEKFRGTLMDIDMKAKYCDKTSINACVTMDARSSYYSGSTDRYG